MLFDLSRDYGNEFSILSFAIWGESGIKITNFQIVVSCIAVLVIGVSNCNCKMNSSRPLIRNKKFLICSVDSMKMETLITAGHVTFNCFDSLNLFHSFLFSSSFNSKKISNEMKFYASAEKLFQEKLYKLVICKIENEYFLKRVILIPGSIRFFSQKSFFLQFFPCLILTGIVFNFFLTCDANTCGCFEWNWHWGITLKILFEMSF